MKTINKDTVLAALSRHVGAANGITARDLVVEITQRADTPGATRRLRKVIEELREVGHHVGGDPQHGYYICADEDELLATCRFLFSRAMTTLTQISRMRKIALPDIAGQLRLRD